MVFQYLGYVPLMLFLGMGVVIVAFEKHSPLAAAFAVAWYAFVFSAANLLSENTFLSFLIATSMVIAQYLVSYVKYRSTGFNLSFNDILGYDTDVFAYLARTYVTTKIVLRAAFAVFVFVAVAVIASTVAVHRVPGFVAEAGFVISSVGLLCLAVFARLHPPHWDQKSGHIGTFIGQALSQGFRRADPHQLELHSAVPVEGVDAPPLAGDENGPHIILIIHESTFRPALFGFPESEALTDFFSGSSGAKRLRTEVTGGNSIMTVFSILTGLSTSLFGPNKAFVTRFWTGRIKRSIATFLKFHGYRPIAIFSDRATYMGMGAFYWSVGFERIREPSDYLPDGARSMHDKRDAEMFAEVANEVRRHRGPQPLFICIDTAGNHGPHNRVKFHGEDLDRARRWFEVESERNGRRSTSSLSEYIARLTATIADYSGLVALLSDEFPDDRFLIINLGDHQPGLTGDLTDSGLEELETFINAHAVNYDLEDNDVWNHEWVHVADVDLFIAKAAGLGLDGFLKAKLEMMRGDEAPATGSISPGQQNLAAGLEAAGLLLTSARKRKVRETAEDAEHV